MISDARSARPSTAELLRSMLPAGVAFAADLDADPERLPGLERAAVARAIPKRALEFARGRACARAALAELGIEGVDAIPAAANRAPIWPAGVVGAITHCDGFVAAAAARASTVAGIGIDAETARPPLDAGVVRLVCTENERTRLGGMPPSDIDWPRVVFSAKEAVHKVVSPIADRTLGFHDVELDLEPDSCSFRVRPARPLGLEGLDLRRLMGAFGVTENHVVTVVVLPNETTDIP